MRIGLIGASSEKQTAQHRENLRKNSLGNYKSAASCEIVRQFGVPAPFEMNLAIFAGIM
jgi:hypothetical protein